AAQNGEVLGDGRLRDGETFGDAGYGGFAAGEVLEDGEACGVGEGLEEGDLAFFRHAEYISHYLYVRQVKFVDVGTIFLGSENSGGGTPFGAGVSVQQHYAQRAECEMLQPLRFPRILRI